MRKIFFLTSFLVFQLFIPAGCVAFGPAADSIPAQAPSVMDSLRREADMLFARTQYEQAAGLYRRVITADTLDFRAMALLGSCLMRSGQPRPAVKLFIRALALEPELRLGYLGLAYSYYRLGRLDSCRIWADSCRLILTGPQREEWEQMLREFFPLIYQPEDE